MERLMKFDFIAGILFQKKNNDKIMFTTSVLTASVHSKLRSILAGNNVQVLSKIDFTNKFIVRGRIGLSRLRPEDSRSRLN